MNTNDQQDTTYADAFDAAKHWNTGKAIRSLASSTAASENTTARCEHCGNEDPHGARCPDCPAQITDTDSAPEALERGRRAALDYSPVKYN